MDQTAVSTEEGKVSSEGCERGSGRSPEVTEELPGALAVAGPWAGLASSPGSWCSPVSQAASKGGTGSDGLPSPCPG